MVILFVISISIGSSQEHINYPDKEKFMKMSRKAMKDAKEDFFAANPVKWNALGLLQGFVPQMFSVNDSEELHTALTGYSERKVPALSILIWAISASPFLIPIKIPDQRLEALKKEHKQIQFNYK